MIYTTGRPTVMTPEILAKLSEGFSKGFTDEEACLYADIATTTFYRYCTDNEDFREYKETLKKNPLILAKTTIFDNLDKIQTATWYAERRDPELKPKQKVENEIKGDLNITGMRIITDTSDTLANGTNIQNQE